MVSYKVKIAIAPCRRNMPTMNMPGRNGQPPRRRMMWGREAALDVKNEVLPYIFENFANEHVEFVTLDGWDEDGMMYDYSQADSIAEYLKAQKPDALFILNLNFGSEEVAGRLAKLMNLPTLLWAVQDTYFGDPDATDIHDEANGGRLLDAQCGMFAVSKILQRYQIKFTHIPTCKVTDEVFKTNFEDFCAVTCMLKNWKNMRLMQLGNRPLAFTSMMFNEDELLEKFGIEVFPLSGPEASRRLLDVREKHADELQGIVDKFLTYFKAGDIEEARNSEALRNSAACYLFYKELFETTGASAIACDMSFSRAIGPSSTADIMMLANENKFVMFEGDMHGGITEVILSSAVFGEKLPFFGEFTANHPTNPNAELIWHTAVYPPAIAGNDNFEPYIINSGWGAQTGLEVKKGDYSIARFDTMNGKYSMLIGEFKAVDGPFTKQHYIWGEFKDWHKFEQATVYGPYVHHMVEMEGGPHVTRRLKEFCRYVGIYADVPDERDTPFAPYFYDVK